MGWTSAMCDYTEKEVASGYAEADLMEQMNMDRGAMEPVHQRLLLFRQEPLESYEEAEKFLMNTKAQYHREKNTGVRYYVHEKNTSRKMADLNRRLVEVRKKEAAYREAHAVKNFKASLIGCPKCGSKLAKDYLRGDRCPLCSTLLQSQTTIDTLARYREREKEIEKKIRDEEKKKKKEVRWLLYGQAYLG